MPKNPQMHTYTLIQSSRRECWESPICVTHSFFWRKLWIAKHRPALLSLSLSGHLNSGVFNSSVSAFGAGSCIAPNHKSQKQPSSSTPALLVQLLTCFYRAIITSSTKPKTNQLWTFSPPQITASCAVLLLLHTRGLSKETSASQSLHRQDWPYLGSPQHVQHVPSCSVFVSHGHCQGRQHRCFHLWSESSRQGPEWCLSSRGVFSHHASDSSHHIPWELSAIVHSQLTLKSEEQHRGPTAKSYWEHPRPGPKGEFAW